MPNTTHAPQPHPNDLIGMDSSAAAGAPDRAQFRALYDQVAGEMIETAPPGLSREQFDELVFQEIDRRSSVRPGASLLNRAVPAAMRMGGTIAGSVMGSALGPAGTVGGGMMGAGVGEYAAEYYEQLTGQRDEINPTQLAVQTGLGAIPMGKVAGATIGQIAARRALQGAGMGAVSSGATEMAETGELPSLGNVASGSILGALTGGGAGALEGRALRRLGRRDLPPAPRHEPAGLLPSGPRFVGAADGRVGSVGDVIDVEPVASHPVEPGGSVPAAVAYYDGSGQPVYSSDVNAVSAQRRVRGVLPEARQAIPLAGDVEAPRPDPSGVRGVPAAVYYDDSGQPVFVGDPDARSVERPVRGLLPAGPRFVVDGEGNIAPVDQADRLAGATTASRPESESSVRGVPAAPISRELRPARMPHEAIRVSQYSGDVNAPPVPFLDDEGRRLLQAAIEDFSEFTSQRGRQVRLQGGTQNDVIYAHGHAGTPIGDDIRTSTGTRAGNDAIVRAMNDLLEDKAPTNKLHIGVLDWIENVKGGTPGYHAPQAAALRAIASRAAPAGDDFDKFAALFEDVDSSAFPRVGREPGEEGFGAAGLVARAGGVLGGGLVGAATGDTPEERLENALLYGAAGAAAPSLVAGLRRRSPASAVDSTPPAQRATRPLIVTGVVPRGSGPGGAGLNPLSSQRVQGAPRRDPLAGMEPLLEKFGGANPLLREGIAERLSANGGFDAQRRGRLDVETQGTLAEAVRVDVERVLPRGTTLSGEAVAAYTRAVKSTMDRVRELGARVRAGQATDADVIAFHAAQADADVVLKSLMGARSETGRALWMYRTFSALLETGDVNLYRKAAIGLREDAAELAAKVAGIQDPLEQYRFLQSQNRPSLTDKFRSYYFANILSGIKTHERNAIGNAASVLTRFASTPVAAGLDAARVAVRGGQREVFLGELEPAAVGAVAGLEQGFKAFAFTLRHGVSPDALRRSVGAAVERGQLDVPRVEFGGGGANPFNWPGRMLDASDALFRSTARNAELYASAFAQAKREGLQGERLIARAADLRADAAVQLAAERFATSAVFQDTPGPITGALQAAVRSIPGGFFVVPFLKTPSNLARAGVQASPVGFLTKAGRQGGRAGAQARGLAAVGTLALAPLAWLAATNRLSGSGPSDRAERAALMESGWRPNSVRIGDTWYEYSLAQPVSFQAHILANAYESWRHAGSKEDADIVGIVTQIAARSGRSLLEQSYLSGLYDFLAALESPERFAAQWTGRTAHSLTPFAGVQRTVTQATDTTVRMPKTAGEVFQSNVPGLSRRVEPRLNRFGEEVSRPGGRGAAIDPFNRSPVAQDSVSSELQRLGVSLDVPNDRIALPQGVQLTSEQSFALRRDKGQAVRLKIEQLLANPNYQRLPDALKAKALEKIKRAASGQANDRVRGDLIRDRRRILREQLGEREQP